MMNNQVNGSIKRHQFAESIRQQFRQKLRKQIRMRVERQQTELHVGLPLDEQTFHKIKEDCYSTKFNDSSILRSALQYLCQDLSLIAFAEQKIIKFLIQASNHMHTVFDQNRMSLKQQISRMIYKSVKRILEYQINTQQQGQSTYTLELGQLKLLRNCFYPIFKLANSFVEYFQLWQLISLINNQYFINSAFSEFCDVVPNKIVDISAEQIYTIGVIMHNFMDCEALENNKRIKIVMIINDILKMYNLGTEDLKLMLGILKIWLDNHTKGENIDYKVSYIAKQTTIIQNVVIYLDRTNSDYKHTNPEAVAAISKFIAKIFCANDEVCHTAYYNCMSVIQYLRSWLPAEKNITKMMLEQSHRGHATHNNHMCTQAVLYALSNIVGTDNNFIEIFLKTDIFRALIYLNGLVPIKCREQINACIYNMVYKSSRISLNIMLDCKLTEIISQMLSQRNEQILLKTLQMSILMYQDLAEDQMNQQNTPQWQYTPSMLAQLFDKIGVLSSCQRLLSHENDKISELALNFLNTSEKFKNQS